MPIEELLAQVGAEYEILKAKYDNAMLEITFLRTKLTTEHVEDQYAAIKKSSMSQTRYFRENLQEDAEVAAFEHAVVCEQLHCTHPVVLEDEARHGTSSCTHPGVLEDEARHGTSSSLDLAVKQQSGYLHFSSRIGKDVDSANPWQISAHRFLVHPVVESSLVMILMLNCMIMWIETDAHAASSKAASWIESIDTVFLVLYMFEFALRVFAYRGKVFRDKWTRLDFLVLVTDVSSGLSKMLFDTSFAGGLNISLFRLFRLFRVARVFKVFRHVTELKLLIFGFHGAVKGVFYAVVMLEIVIILFSFVLVETIHPIAIESQCEGCFLAYSSMWRAHLSIVQQIIAGDSWGQVNMLIIDAHPETALVFITCLVIIQFVMLNLIFSVIVDAAHRARHEDEQEILAEKENDFKKLKERLIGLLHAFDTDGNGELSLQELSNGYLSNPDFADTMASLDVSAEDMKLLFTILDEDCSGEVSSVEFVNNIYKLKEQDTHTTLMFIRGYLVDLRSKVRQEMQRVTGTQKDIKDEIEIVAGTQRDIKDVMRDLGLMVPSSATRNSKADAGMTIEAKPLEERLLVEPHHKAAKICEAVDLHLVPKKSETKEAAEDVTCFHVSEDMIRPPPVRVPTSCGLATSISESNII